MFAWPESWAAVLEMFAWPMALLALPVPLLLRWLLPPVREAAPALRTPYGLKLDPIATGARRSLRGAGPGWLAWAAWVALCIAAARPQELGDALQPPRVGRDLMLALDLSGSMSEMDMELGSRAVDRLTAAKAVIADFLDRREGDRVALLVFGRQAYALTPLTLDRETVREQLSDSVVGLAGQETAIGDAIALGVKRLRTQPAQQRVLILLTDGVNTAGALDPVKAAELARNEHVRVHTIAFGGEGSLSLFGFKLPMPGAGDDIDETTLKRVAELTGGESFRARDTSELAGIYAQIDRMEPIRRPGKAVRPRLERYAWPLGVAFGLALLAFAWRGATRMNPLPMLQDALQSLHLLRPHWLWALLPLPLLLLWWRRRWRERSAWRAWVDPHLLAHLIEPVADRRTRAGPVLAAIAYVLAVVALAGPSWRESAQPLWESRTALVVVLDLSSAMRAGDLPPSRLAQARAKLAMLLKQRDGGPIALVAYAGDAFTVAPLTDDAANVALFLDSLDPDVMPVDGARADRAIELSVQLLERAGMRSGDIVLMTGAAAPDAIEAARTAATRGYRVSALGLGTATGAPYPDAEGALAQARLDAGALHRLAAAGGGQYTALSSDTSDLAALGILRPRTDRGANGGGDRGGLAWEDDGYWLLPPLMLLALFAFRRRSGGALALVACLGLLPWMPAQAQGVWRRADQVAHAQLEKGNAAYRRGDFAQAADDFASLDDATAHYNRGNALARAGRYPDAIAAYDQALRREPGMPDALANKKAVEAMMKRSPSSQDQDNEKSGQGQRGEQSGQGAGQSGAPPSQSSPRPSPSQPQARQRSGAPPAQPPKPSDAQAQQQADRAQRERMQRALQQAKAQPGGKPPQARKETAQERERRLANEAWLRRVPDDPGGLLRAKFRLEYERRQLQGRAP